MNRHLRRFVIFVVLLLAAGGGAMWWFGVAPALLLDSARRENPVLLYDFSGLGDVAEDPEVERTRQARLVAVQAEGGAFLFHGRLLQVLDGRLAGAEWQALDIYRFGSGADYLRMRTAPGQGGRASEARRRLVLASGQGDAVEPVPDAGVRLIWVFRRRDDHAFDSVEGFVGTLSARGATGIHRAEVETYEGKDAWDLVLTCAFPSREAALAWYRDTRTRTELAIMKSRFASTAGMLYLPIRPGGGPGSTADGRADTE
ncbi:MAG: hypothetical protein H6993_03785 [Pseudomonadales bacterium]|nr:hypothetical protein [Pseudomonadales bacterium]MCP5183055.1 hypothetical protein [Pseudomonadales bacterium]